MLKYLWSELTLYYQKNIPSNNDNRTNMRNTLRIKFVFYWVESILIANSLSTNGGNLTEKLYSTIKKFRVAWRGIVLQINTTVSRPMGVEM
jgi:hypothetical protein